jgi:hypothetical protein
MNSSRVEVEPSPATGFTTSSRGHPSKAPISHESKVDGYSSTIPATSSSTTI